MLSSFYHNVTTIVLNIIYIPQKGYVFVAPLNFEHASIIRKCVRICFQILEEITRTPNCWYQGFCLNSSRQNKYYLIWLGILVCPWNTMPPLCQEETNIIPTWNQHDSKLISIWYQHDVELILNSSPNHPQIIPKSSRYHPEVNNKSSQHHLNTMTNIIPKSYQTHTKLIPNSSPKSSSNHHKTISYNTL